MRLIKCRKCGTSVATDNTVLESLIGQMNSCSSAARKCKPSQRNSYAQQAAQLGKLITQIQHRETMLEQRRSESLNLKMLKGYLIENKLMSYEQLDEVERKANLENQKKIEQDEKAIQKLYGEAQNVTINRSNKDDTANNAFKRVR